MYEELVERLRVAAKVNAAMALLLPQSNGNEMTILLNDAADAIEELSKQVNAIPRRCECCVGCELEKKNGEGCDDGFILSPKRAIEYIEDMSKPRWIPVTERLPEDGADILAVKSYCGEVRIIPANYDRGVWFDCVFNHPEEHIAHWMPLPEPPKEEK